MLELLFLLLPIAAAYGWYMGKRSNRITQQRSSDNLTKNYFEGLNFLLSDQPDKAVDRFIELLQVDSHTFDTHLSLGNLFRKRGEVDRSIRLHQNLIARPSLSLEQKDMAMMELAKDYLAAGLFDRAEEILVQLIKEPDHSDEAEKQLLSVYQATKEWWKAINLVKRFKRANRKQLQPQLAHFYCQLADESKDDKERFGYWQQAIKLDQRCGRAYIAQFKAYCEQQQFDRAINVLSMITTHCPEWFAETLPQAIQPFQQQNLEPEYQQMLHSVLDKHQSATVTLALADTMPAEDAQAMILAQLKRQPTMKGFHHLMKLHADAMASDSSRDSLLLLSDLVEKQIRLRPKYRCLQCGFPGHSLHWHCPSCKSWGQIQRIQGLDGD
ncbi:lipopolysaccharide assembly protein LapB [Ferrimonas lipolytica]|uniref:Lipopolysaccharide assembly protein B n=1 Tax=Ferrimonas lipolytica TaxID=2724191 RepID=A0A6H1UBY8_9GAMM|nr:lipopolysaccharide assembly protein LapB [Ferrimonas lipolytica]QIZ76607.1 lipopolysaccharide assembly protein LapB [Ferrimonas lipolytica]